MKLSVIVPCYNVAPWVGRCLLSITNQSLTDLEIICIDDKSTDNTLEILKMCAKNDLRIRILENDENKGVGYTRNRGIDAATGEFVGFVDPDDWIDSDFYEKLVKTAEKTLTPVVCGDVIEHPIVGKPKELKRPIKKNHYHFSYHYTAIYLRDFLNRYNLHYPNLCIGEDSVFEASVKVHMPKPIIHVRKTSYHYMKRLNSLNSKIWNDKQVSDFITAIGQIIEIYNMATHVTDKEYNIGVERHFSYMLTKIFNTSVTNQTKLAMAACELFKRLKSISQLVKSNYPMVLALLNNDVPAIIDIVKNQRIYTRYYKLFDKYTIARIHFNSTQKTVYIFGIKIWKSVLT